MAGVIPKAFLQEAAWFRHVFNQEVAAVRDTGGRE